MIVQADFHRVDEVLPRVLSFKLAISLLVLVDAAVSLLVGVGDLVFALVGDAAQLVTIDVYLGGLHLQALQHLISPVDGGLAWLVVLQDLALQTLVDALMIVPPALVDILQLAPSGVNPLSTGGKEGV